jgi:predicted Zn-dependent protease with MMP-like domain
VLDDLDMEPGDTPFGLYHGTPDRARLDLWQYAAGPHLDSPAPIEDACEGEEDIRQCIAETVIHEFGHYFGLSEEEIEEIEERYWRGMRE